MNLLHKLTGGDLRSIGESNKVVDEIGNNQKLFDEVFEGIFSNNPLIRMRAADVTEKVSRKYPVLLKKHKKKILNNLPNFKQQEVRWHISLMLSCLDFSNQEVETVFNTLSKWIETDESKIVRVNSLQALEDISLKNRNFKEKTLLLIKDQIETGVPSIVSRGKKLLKRLL